MISEFIKVLEEYNLLGIQQQLDYDKFYLYSIITHSTAIEGSTVTEIENQLLFDEGISANKPMTEQLMNLDLKAAYEQSFVYAKSHTDFSIDLLCSLAAIVMKNTGSTYKTISGDFSSAKGELRLLNVSAGRGGKSYLAWQNVIPSIVKKENRAEYIQSLSQGQDAEDSSAFIDFMISHHIENIRQQIEEYKESMER